MAEGEALATLNPRVDELFIALEERVTDITFGDVTLPTIMTDYRADQVSLKSPLTCDIELQTPFLSAAMDTVSEHEMAITMARAGGIAVLHGALTPKQLKEEARLAKYDLSRRIETPVCAQSGQTIHKLLKMCEKKNYRFRNFPVTDNEGRPIGILTAENLKYWHGDQAETVDEYMQEIITAGLETDEEQAYKLMKKRKSPAVGLTDEDGRIKALYVWSDVKRLKDENQDIYSLDSNGRLMVAAAVSTRPKKAAKRVEVAGKYVDVFVVDSSHCNSKEAADTVRFLCGEYGKDFQVIGGNVTDGESALRLAAAGAKAIKVGIGGGTICTTREKTGNGRPQLSAVYWVKRALMESGRYAHIPVISDGGITSEGDANKAIAVGASTVMMGGRFAATLETPGEVLFDEAGKKYKIYRGMGSTAAQLAARHARGYTSGDADQIFPEGVVSHVPLKGSAKHVIAMHNAGLRNAVSNANANTIEGFQRNTPIRLITPSGVKEAGAHIGQQGTIVAA